MTRDSVSVSESSAAVRVACTMVMPAGKVRVPLTSSPPVVSKV